jgi:hypothetical protein
MNFSSDILHLKDAEGNNPYLFSGPNLELPSPRRPALNMYLSIKLYWPLTSRPTLLVWPLYVVNLVSAFNVREGDEGSCNTEDAVLERNISCDTYLLS